MKKLALGLVALLASSAQAQVASDRMMQPKPTETVNFNQYDPGSGKYSGSIQVNGSACPGTALYLSIPFPPVKNEAEARAAVKTELANIERDFAQQSMNCKAK